MIRSVEISRFKQFERLNFSLPNRVVVVGPNYSGKTSLLQAIFAWSELANIWLESYGDYPTRDQDGKYKSVKLNLAEFNAVELSSFGQLWWHQATSMPIGIKVSSERWNIGFNLKYEEPSIVSISPMIEVSEEDLIAFAESRISVLYIQSLSGLDAVEPLYGEGVIAARLACGKGGRILRSLLHTVSKNEQAWEQLQQDISSFFGYVLSQPSGVDPIIATYRHDVRENTLDLASGSSGFLQTVLILSALHFKNPSILLVDEPDVHLHTLLKEKIYRHLRRYCESQNCQLIVATHSNLLIEEARREENDALQLISGDKLIPIRTGDAHEIMKLSTEHVINAKSQKSVLYLEGKSDIDILREWANVLKHPVSRHLEQVFYVFTAEIKSKKRNTRKHLSALKSLVPELTAIEILDRNSRAQYRFVDYKSGDLDIDSTRSKPDGYTKVIWTRREIENYLIHPKALERYVYKCCGSNGAKRAKQYLKQQLPNNLQQNPFASSAIDEASGKQRINDFLNDSGVKIKDAEYYTIASQMEKDEIHPEVVDMLNLIHKELFDRHS